MEVSKSLVSTKVLVSYCMWQKVASPNDY